MISEKVNVYINALYAKNDFNKKNYIEASELKTFGTLVDDDISRMLQLLAKISRPKKVLEIGTSIGYSTISLAKAIQDYGGKIITIEYDPKSAQQAIKNFEQAGVAENSEVKIGDANEIIPGMQDNQFDLIFQDVGDKRLYAKLFHHCVRLLKPGGLLLAEDSLLFMKHNKRPEWTACIQEFNEMVANCPDLESTLLPIGDGLTIALKKA